MSNEENQCGGATIAKPLSTGGEGGLDRMYELVENLFGLVGPYLRRWDQASELTGPTMLLPGQSDYVVGLRPDGQTVGNRQVDTGVTTGLLVDLHRVLDRARASDLMSGSRHEIARGGVDAPQPGVLEGTRGGQ